MLKKQIKKTSTCDVLEITYSLLNEIRTTLHSYKETYLIYTQTGFINNTKNIRFHCYHNDGRKKYYIYFINQYLKFSKLLFVRRKPLDSHSVK